MATSFIKDLVADKFCIFNVGEDKAPINRAGWRMKGWEKKTYTELVEEHNYNCNRWGLSLGEQENGRFIMSLDFDIYDKETDGDCPNTKNLLNTYLENCANKNGMYSSSTTGNINVLVDYSLCEALKTLLQEIGANKFVIYGLEVLIKGNQVIPPTQTKCKRTQQLGNPRTFKNNEPFYVITEQDDFTHNFITDLCQMKLSSKPKTVRRNKQTVKEEEKKEDETDEETDEETEDKTGKNNKYNEIKECAEIISESRYLKSGKYTEWINIIWALRSMNNEDYKQIAYDLAKRCNRDAEKYVDVYWDNYNATKNVTIASLFYYAKESDEKEFYKIKNKYAVEKYFDFITIENMIQTASESDFADIFYKQFKNNMVLDGDNLYLYYDNEWRYEKESKPHILINMIDKWCKEYIKRCYVLVGKSKAEFVDDEEMIKFLNKFDKNIAKMNLGCKKVNFCKNVATFLKSKMSVIFDKKPFDIGEQDHYNINFKNGVYDMKNKIFRERCYYDYITKWLDYDYIESEKISAEIHTDVLDFFKKIQPDKEQRDLTIGFLSYCLTGNIDKQKFKMNIGYSAQNGKSTELGIHDKCFPIYTKKLNRETFDTGYTKRHKHIIDILNNPIRLAYVEELSERKMDTEFIKDFVDAKKISCEVMFGTDETKKIQAKMMTVGNSDFNAKTDEGLKRRGLIQHYTSKFVKEGEFSEENHIYERIDGFENRFADDKYKNAYFHLLLQYTDNLIIPKVNEDAFKEVCDDNDHFKNTLFDSYELTGDPNHAVYWKDICVLFGSTPAKANRKNISNEMKRLNLMYDKDKFCNGKGCYLGLKLLEVVEENKH